MSNIKPCEIEHHNKKWHTKTKPNLVITWCMECLSSYSFYILLYNIYVYWLDDKGFNRILYTFWLDGHFDSPKYNFCRALFFNSRSNSFARPYVIHELIFKHHISLNSSYKYEKI